MRLASPEREASGEEREATRDPEKGRCACLSNPPEISFSSRLSSSRRWNVQKLQETGPRAHPFSDGQLVLVPQLRERSVSSILTLPSLSPFFSPPSAAWTDLVLAPPLQINVNNLSPQEQIIIVMRKLTSANRVSLGDGFSKDRAAILQYGAWGYRAARLFEDEAKKLQEEKNIQVAFLSAWTALHRRWKKEDVLD